ncbi:TadE/TadG family type IV pilus assembly protein [Pasteurella canis]|uniref:TadE/TadG family type IV pilus assembly protein n=1 Tax=Pasteurella canis TaxID=753 RepID=UPI001CBF4B6F|nr:TadE family protein [Pasteurella canis]UAX43001.1 pilus assembly protein [Pasteurella canis]
MKKLLRNTNGVASIEFTLTIGIYIFVVMLIFEFCRLAITTAYWDLAISESVRIAKNEQLVSGDYKTAFENALKEQRKVQGTSTLGYLAQLQKGNIDIDVKYVNCVTQQSKCVEELLNGNFIQPTKDSNGNEVLPSGVLATLAYYSLTYNYEFLIPLPFIPKVLSEAILKREFVAVQEHQRPLFQPPQTHSKNN